MLYDILLIIYVVGTVAGLWLLFKKAGIAPWKSVVPLYNIVVWIRLCGKSWRWYIYMLLPAVNIFCFLLLVQETARVFRRYSFWEQLLAVLVPFAYLPWLGLKKDIEWHDPKVDPPAKISEARDWTEAIVFAVIAAVIIRAFTFELYSIPSSSMEKSLLVGDHLLVSKLAYGPRVIMTPLSLPLMHNTIPGTKEQVESYLKWPQLPYHRFPGYSHVKRYDAVVFNFPEGDTISTLDPTGGLTYYSLVAQAGSREAVLNHPEYFGRIKTRPLEKKQNYIKRCIGLPGETLQVVDRQVMIDGRPIELPTEAQFKYQVYFKPFTAGYKRILDNVGVSGDDIQHYTEGYGLPLSNDKLERLRQCPDVDSIVPWIEGDTPMKIYELFPHDAYAEWTENNYGPVHIPAKGEVLELNDSTLPLYRRLITSYEHNTLEVRSGKIYINGQETTTYTCRQNYYWLMGDNRHMSQDSRFWGFVPEDHIVGKAKWILWSVDKDHGGLRKGRFFRNACAR